MKPISIALFCALLCILATSCGADPEQTQIVVQPETECEADGDCGEVGQGCVRGFCECVDAGCVCRRDADCGGSMLCDAEDGSCFEPECLGDGSCLNEGEVCLRGRCEASLVDDADRDGVPDAEDNCPRVDNADQDDLDGDEDGDACDDDDDGDTVPDTTDNCPNVVNRPSGTDNTQGDANNDGLGNVCDPVIRGTTVVGRLDLSAGGGPDPTAARISLTGEGVYNPAPVAVIDETGGFVFDQALFASGFFTVRVERAGFVVFRKDFVSTNTLGFDTNTLSLVPESDDALTAVIMRGRTLLQDSQRHSGILVELQIGEETVASTVTNPEGAFVLTASRVDHRLRFSKEGFITDEQNVVWNTEAVQFELGGVPIEEADPPVLAPLLDADLEGQISTPIEGFPVRDAVVILTGDVAQRLGVDDEGGFGIENQAPGLYRLDVSLDGHRDESFIVELASGLNTLDPIQLEAIERSLEGRVVTRIEVDGEGVEVPLENVAVRLRLDGQLAVPPSLSDEQGRFLFDVLPLSYTLSLSAANFLPRTIEVEFDGEDFIVDGEPLGLDSPLELVRAPESDRDRDGVIDLLDNCPESFNPDLRDIDGDGRGDTCDADADGDGMVNGLDNCPFSFNPMQEDPDGLGRGFACSGGTLEAPFEVNLGIARQHIDTRERADLLQGSCGGGGAPEAVYRLAFSPLRPLSVGVRAEHGVVVYLLDERGVEVGCTVGGRMEIPGDMPLSAGNFSIVVDGFSGPGSAGPIEVDITAVSDASYEASRTFSVGTTPRNVVLGDVTGDGALDIVTTNFGANTVSVLPGDDQGNFDDTGSPQAPRDIAVGLRPKHLALGDLNGDGRLDIVAVNEGSGNISVLLGSGQGRFEAARTFETGGRPPWVALGDVNGDGILDVAVAKPAGHGLGKVAVLLGDGGGGFGNLRNFTVEKEPLSVDLADMDGDGHIDIVTANEFVHNTSVLRGDGVGGFGAPHTFRADFKPHTLALADLDRNGHLDILISHPLIPNAPGIVGVLLADGDGGFETKRSFDMGQGPFRMTVGDFDSDGHTDFIVPNTNNNNVMFRLNGGNQSFETRRTFAVGPRPDAVAIGHLDDDGHIDIVTANQDNATVSVLMSSRPDAFAPPNTANTGIRPAVGATGDLDGDGHIDIVTANDEGDSVSALLGDGRGGFGPARNFLTGDRSTGVVLGDVDGDGNLDIINTQLNAGLDILLGDGLGDFTLAQQLTAGDGPAGAATGDFNGDDALDFAVVNIDSNDMSVFLNTGDGLFELSDTLPIGDHPEDLAVGDINGDGRPDIVTINEGTNNAIVFRNTGNGAFVESLDLAVGGAPRGVILEDANGDGHLDILTANFGDRTVGVFLGDGQGDFDRAAGCPGGCAAGNRPRSLVLGDIDEDGHLDVVTANFQGDDVSVLRGNGQGGFDAPQNFPAGDGAFSVFLEDTDKDGHLDILTVDLEANTISTLRGLHRDIAPNTRLTQGRLPSCPASTSDSIRLSDHARQAAFTPVSPCRVDRLELDVGFVGNTLGPVSLTTPLKQTLAVPPNRDPSRASWQPEIVPELARFESQPLAGQWKVRSESPLDAVTLHVNSYPDNPFAPETLAPACVANQDQSAEPGSACRMVDDALDGVVLENDADEDVFLLEGNFDGAFIQGQTITVMVETANEQALLVGLKAFRAARALEVAEEVAPGVWALSFAVPPEYSGRFFAVHVKGLGVSELDYTIGVE